MLGGWGDDGSVHKDNNGARSVQSFEMLLDESSDLLEGTERSVGNSNEEVLAFLSISLLISDFMDAVDKNDAKMSFE